ncbi:MAG: caspase family protein [Bacteroidales bacterium]|nr:caspase family protein [Bacteroidales bacterium]
MKAAALIIGNSNYLNNVLDNPENDANDIAEIIGRLGFKTNTVLNANTVTQDKTITEFAKSLDEYDIGLFYFAGHGFQLNNANYLAAIDTNFDDEEHAAHSAFSLNMLLSYLSKSKNRTSIIILDACRELLNKKSWYRSVGNAGLAPVYAPKGTLIAYATSPGEKALDGTGRRNGIYTGALLEHMVAEIPIEEMFKRVRNTVFALSKGKQTSWEHTSLTGTFFFNSGQLSHSLSIEYNDRAIKDSLYEVGGDTLADLIIKDLKSHNFYIQNPAIDNLRRLNLAEEDMNKLFLIGRNILQSACGSANSAERFMNNLEERIDSFTHENKNHVLNGIIFETFFDAYGSFRQDNIKSEYLSELYKTLDNERYKESMQFLNVILQPHNNVLFYNPSINSTGISLDIEFETVSEEIILKSIKYETQDILVEQDYDEIWGFSGNNSYTLLNYKKLKRRIAEDIFVPESKLTINSNIEIDDEQELKYPSNTKLMK